MKKIKRVFAILVSLAMVMGMSLTSFAADKEATITINNAGTGATFQYVQVIKPDQTAKTGWKFASNAIESKYLTAFDVADAQQVLELLINESADAGKIQVALKSILEDVAIELSIAAASPLTVTEAGVYAIKGEETGYAYSPMAAYVGFKDYDRTTGIPTALENTSVEAKKASTTVEKSNTDGDKVIEIGKIVTYNINTTVPYTVDGTVNPKYIVKDTITGANYVTNTEGKIEVTVKIGENLPQTYLAIVNGNSFVLDLSAILEGNKYANNELTITYTATVTDTLIGNDIQVGNGTNDTEYGTDSDKLITGEATLTKTGENQTVLAGAEFVVYKSIDGITYFAKFDAVNKLTGWVDSESAATKVITDIDGKVKVQGLDSSVVYKFKEVKAPEGYSINTTDVEVIWDAVDQSLTQVVQGNTSMVDTKLGQLPSTGGIGTTIFTIGGCLIMIIAAALFFASRKKSSK